MLSDAPLAASEELKDMLGLWMLNFDFKSPQTFTAACSYASHALSTADGAVSIDLAAACSVLTAGQLYEHERWLMTDASDLCGFGVEDLDCFFKMLLQTKKGRLLVPFCTSRTAFDKHCESKRKAKKKQQQTRRRKKGRSKRTAATAMGELSANEPATGVSLNVNTTSRSDEFVEIANAEKEPVEVVVLSSDEETEKM